MQQPQQRAAQRQRQQADGGERWRGAQPHGVGEVEQEMLQHLRGRAEQYGQSAAGHADAHRKQDEHRLALPESPTQHDRASQQPLDKHSPESPCGLRSVRQSGAPMSLL